MLADCREHRSSVPFLLDLLRLKWCSEPSVHGGKKTAPEG